MVHHCHSGCEWKRQLYSAYDQIFEWPVDNANVGRDGLVDVDWLVKRGTHIANDHILALRASELMLLVPFDHRRPRPLGWERRKRRSSQAEFLRDLLRANRRPDLEKQPMRFAELAFADDVVTAEPCQVSALVVEEGR